MTTRSVFRIFMFLLVFCSVHVAQGQAQDFPMLHFTNYDGLPGNTVYEIFRDNKGFLWFGTDKGVARYNGAKFQVFTTFNGLPDNEIIQFSEDLHGRLWMGSLNGELCYFQNDTFHTSSNTQLLRLPSHLTHVRSITPQKDSSVIVSFSNNTAFVNMGVDKYNVIDVKRIYNKEKMGELLYRKKIAINRYQLTFANTTVFVDTQMNVRQQYDVDTFRMDAGGNSQMSVSCQNQDYLFNRQRIYTSNLTLVASLPPDFHRTNYLNRVFLSQDHKFFATGSGLYIDDSIQLLKGHNVSSVTNDRYGNFWISTLNDGVFVMKTDFYSTRIFKDAYAGRVLYSNAYKQELFFAANNNNLYHLENDALKCIVNYADIMHEKLVANATQLFFVDTNYGYFNVSGHNLIYKSNVFDNSMVVKNIEATQGAKGLFYQNNYLYLQKQDAILKMKLDLPLTASPVPFRIGITPKDDRILWVQNANLHALWYSTMDGMYRISEESTVQKLSVFGSASLKMFEFVGDDMIGFTPNNLFLIFRGAKSGISIDTIKVRDCIWDRMYKIDEDHVLLSTNSLYRMLTATRVNGRSKYTLSVIDDPFIPLQPEAVSANEHACYFMKGGVVTMFERESILATPPPPRLLFTELRSGDSLYQIGDELTIPFGASRNITISFSVISFVGRNVQYQYSVSKNDNDYWTDIKGEDISLVNSGYGNYTVKIRAKTTSSEFSRPVEFTLRVARPFWARWWFVVLAIAAFIYLVIFLSRKRLTYILNKKDKDHEARVRFLKSEYKALNALMNPHFIFNTLNNVQGLINNNDKLGANEYLRVIADLIRQNMHNISKELIPLQKEMDLVSNYLLLEKFRFKDRLNYTIIVDKDIDLSEIMIPPLLIQPLVENSIKHGILPLNTQEGAIYINIFERKNCLCIEVKDNGVGLNYKKSEKLSTHESFGLGNIRKRIEQLSIIQGKEILFEIKEKKNDAGTGHWTVVTITIPTEV
jgi:ligand-binding sensor domain-containing protein